MLVEGSEVVNGNVAAGDGINVQHGINGALEVPRLDVERTSSPESAAFVDAKEEAGGLTPGGENGHVQ